MTLWYRKVKNNKDWEVTIKPRDQVVISQLWKESRESYSGTSLVWRGYRMKLTSWESLSSKKIRVHSHVQFKIKIAIEPIKISWEEIKSKRNHSNTQPDNKRKISFIPKTKPWPHPHINFQQITSQEELTSLKDEYETQNKEHRSMQGRKKGRQAGRVGGWEGGPR